MSSLVRNSKFLSLILRHKPEKIGLLLDSEGWANVDELLERCQNYGVSLNRDRLEEVVANNNKKRFAFSKDGKRIRASQGHSIDVDLALESQKPPVVLYHGTATRYLDPILAQGLIKGRRQHVHLSSDLSTARNVGMRHGQPVILEVAAGKMDQEGYSFFLSANGVWLTEHVPMIYLQQVDSKENQND